MEFSASANGTGSSGDCPPTRYDAVRRRPRCSHRLPIGVPGRIPERPDAVELRLRATPRGLQHLRFSADEWLGCWHVKRIFRSATRQLPANEQPAPSQMNQRRSNHRPALDAASASCSHSGGHWCRASEAGRWAETMQRLICPLFLLLCLAGCVQRPPSPVNGKLSKKQLA
jgi:hypothetical protein